VVAEAAVAVPTLDNLDPLLEMAVVVVLLFLVAPLLAL
jgi:hypothetical protein